MLPAEAPAWVDMTAVILLGILSAAWHCGLAIVFSAAAVRSVYGRAKVRVDTVIGVILVALGIRLALSK